MTAAKRLPIGARYGRLVILQEAPSRNGKLCYECRCDCGNTSVTTGVSLRCGNTRSCGCLCRDANLAIHKKHGASSRRGGPRLRSYGIWNSMRSRCLTPTQKCFKNYGGRGITVCDRWNDYAAFQSDMGEPKPGETLERVDNEKGYSPDNCVWTTRRKQLLNRRNTIFVLVGGRKTPLREAVEPYPSIKYGSVLDSRKRFGSAAAAFSYWLTKIGEPEAALNIADFIAEAVEIAGGTSAILSNASILDQVGARP